MEQQAISALIEAQPQRHALNRAFYTDADIYDRDLAEIYMKSWLYAGHISKIPAVGSYMLFEFASESVIIYINFANDPAPFAPIRGAMTRCLRPYRLDTAKVAHRKSYSINANWKLSIENYTECYHCAPSHPEYSRGHSLAKPGARSTEAMAEVMSRAGEFELSDKSINRVYLDAEGFGADFAYERYPMWRGHVTGSGDGQSVAPLLGNIKGYDGGTTDFQVGPVTFALAYCDYVVIYRFTPTSKDTSECDITWKYMSWYLQAIQPK